MAIRLKSKKEFDKITLIDLLDPKSMANYVILNMKQDMERLGLRDSNLINSIGYRVVDKEYSWMVQITMPRYAINVNDGRRAGAAMPPVGAILLWLKRKNIAVKNGTLGSVAYAIAKSIQRRGIKPRPFLKNIPTYMEEWIDMELKDMAKTISQELVKKLKKELIGATQGKNVLLKAGR